MNKPDDRTDRLCSDNVGGRACARRSNVMGVFDVPVPSDWPRSDRLAVRENADARDLAGHRGKRRKLRVGTSEIAPFDLFLQGLDLLLHALEAGIDLNRLAVGVQRVLVVADVLHDEAKAR